MPITLTCACGKQLRAPDQATGKRVKCPACGATQTVQPQPVVQPRPVVQPAAVQSPAKPAKSPAAEQTEFDDFEVIEETAPAEAPAKARVKAVAKEEPPAPADPPTKAKKKKKKNKKKQADDGEEGDDWYEKMRAREAWMKRITRGGAFIALGSLIVIGVAIAFIWYSAELKEVGSKTVGGMIIFGLVGVAAIIKGVVGLVFGQFLGDDDD